ncbi:MAG: PAS domain S-box protein, partial [Promethearchaeota archaeon]
MSKPPEVNTESYSKKIADITKKKETEETIRESEVKIKDKKDNLLNILDSMMDGIYIVDQSYNNEYVNPVMIKEFGSPKNKKCYEYIYSRSNPCSWCKISDILEGKTVRSERYFNDNQKTYELIETPLKNSDGTISNLKIFHDITNLRNTINILKLDEDRLNSLLKLSQMKSKSKKEITEFALEECVRLTSSKVGYLHFVNEDQKTIHLYLWSKNVIDQCYQEDNTHYPIDEAGIWADAFRMRKPVIHNDYQSNPNKKGYPEGHFPVIRHMSIPVFDGEKIVAIVGVGNKSDLYDQTDVRQLTLFMESMWSLLKKKEEELAERDKKYIQFLKDLQNFNTSIKTSQNLKELLFILLNAVLLLFDCDRVFLRYPLELEADYFEVPMEATKPEYLGIFSIGKRFPMRPEVLQITQYLLESNDPIAFGPGKAFDFPPGVTWDQFNIKSMITVAIHPKIGSPWEFGIHQCSHPRVWNNYEKELFTEISHRITDSLNNWLFFQKLKESELRYRELVENLNECVAVYDAVDNGSDFLFKDYNKAAEKADQITRDGLLGKTICEMFPGVHEFGLLDVFKRVWKTGVPEHHPITLYKDQRIEGWRENYVYKLPSGEIVAVYQDMTEKVNLDQQLKESEMRYRQLFESSPLYIFLIDLDWNMIDCNFAVERILGYSKEFLIGKNMIDTPLLDYTDINLLRERTQKIIKGGTVEPVELRIPRSDGKLIWVSSTSSLVKIGEKITIQIQGRDITKRREAEQKLRESERLYQDLYEDAPNAYLSIGIDKTIRLCNKAATKLLGYSKEELLKKKVFDLYADTENGLVKARLLFNRFLKGDIIQDEELQMKKKNG